jgi:hypothetical protein
MEAISAMRDLPLNKYRAAMEVLQRGHELLVESLAEEVLDQQDNLAAGGFQLHEFLESHGARLHFLGLIMGHLEQSAEYLEEQARTQRAPSLGLASRDAPLSKRRTRNRGSRSPKPRRQPPSGSGETVDETPF